MAKVSERTAKDTITAWAKINLKPGQLYTKAQIVDWFMSYCQDFKRSTIDTHVYSMSVNMPNRSLNYKNVKPGSGHDLFFKVGSQFRLWDPECDPPPTYKEGVDSDGSMLASSDDMAAQEDVDENQGGDTFALEKDLQNFLVRNLSRLEPGLTLYKQDGVSGIEYNAGGRFIDILAIDAHGSFVVVELKVSRGYDRVIGQLQRYMGWVSQNLAEGQPVRGIIVASEITEDLILATSLIADRVKLFEYSISFSINQRER